MRRGSLPCECRRSTVAGDARRLRHVRVILGIFGALFSADDAAATDDRWPRRLPAPPGTRAASQSGSVAASDELGSKQHTGSADVLSATVPPLVVAGRAIPQRDLQSVSWCARCRPGSWGRVRSAPSAHLFQDDCRLQGRGLGIKPPAVCGFGGDVEDGGFPLRETAGPDRIRRAGTAGALPGRDAGRSRDVLTLKHQ